MEDAKVSWEKMSAKEIENLGTVVKADVDKVDSLKESPRADRLPEALLACSGAGAVTQGTHES
ncbi:hypothetical protein BDV12DRAFT_200083 [Aspergillus spectabilis]